MPVELCINPPLLLLRLLLGVLMLMVMPLMLMMPAQVNSATAAKFRVPLVFEPTMDAGFCVSRPIPLLKFRSAIGTELCVIFIVCVTMIAIHTITFTWKLLLNLFHPHTVLDFPRKDLYLGKASVNKSSHLDIPDKFFERTLSASMSLVATGGLGLMIMVQSEDITNLHIITFCKFQVQLLRLLVDYAERIGCAATCEQKRKEKK